MDWLLTWAPRDGWDFDSWEVLDRDIAESLNSSPHTRISLGSKYNDIDNEICHTHSMEILYKRMGQLFSDLLRISFLKSTFSWPKDFCDSGDPMKCKKKSKINTPVSNITFKQEACSW